MSLAIFIKSAGANINKDNLKDTLTSIVNNTDTEFKFYLVLEESQKTVLNDLKIDDYILKVKTAYEKNSWAYDFNIFYDSVKNDYDWLLYSHDDLKILTKDWFSKSKQIIEKHDNIGWVSYSQPTHYMIYGEPRSQVARPGFHTDRFNYPCIHECRNFDRNSDWGNKKTFLNKIDMPKKPVKIHGPYSVFNLIQMENMKKVGYCADWNPYTMLIDEDWALEALKNHLVNLWIPNIFYEHPLRQFQRKAPDRFKDESKKGFKKKWGFYGGTALISDEVVKEICEQYKDTNIPWSNGRLSYDWDYLK